MILGVQEEIGVSSQRTIGKCGRQQVQRDFRERKEERQDRQTDPGPERTRHSVDR